MEKLDILIWAIAGGFAGTWMMMFYIAKQLNNSICRLEKKLDTLEEKLTDIDRRVCRIEGALMNKECCMLNHESRQKAE